MLSIRKYRKLDMLEEETDQRSLNYDRHENDTISSGLSWPHSIDFTIDDNSLNTVE